MSVTTRADAARSPTLERIAFAALVLLSLLFAFEWMKALLVVNDQAFTNVELLQFALIGVWMVCRLLDGNWRPMPRQLVISILIWLAVLLVSTLLAPDYQARAIRFFSRVLRGVFICWATFDLTRTAVRWQTIARTMVVGAIGVYVLGLAEAANIAPVVDWLTSFRGLPSYVGDLLRITSTLTYTTIAAMVMELTLPLVLAWMLTAQRLWLRVLLGVGLLAGLICLTLTLTRGGVIALLVGFGVMAGAAVYYKRRRVVVGSGVAALSLVVMVVLLLVVRPTVALRLVSENESTWYRAAYQTPATLTARPGEVLSVPITLTNNGVRPWQSSGVRPFLMSYHLSRSEATSGETFEGARTTLPADVPPGQTVEVQAQIAAPTEAGEYLIRWDMLQENVTWFSTQNPTAPAASTQLTVAGEAADNPFEIKPSNYILSAIPPASRLTLWRVALQMVRDHPLLGVGPDNFRWAYGSYAGVGQWNTNVHTNNLYIEWLADTGIIGLLAFLWMNLQLARSAWKGLQRQQDNGLWVWQLALIAGLVVWFIHGFVDYFYEFSPTYIAFWLIAGLAVSAAGREAETAL